MLRVRLFDIKKLYAKDWKGKHSNAGWKTQFPDHDWKNLRKSLRGKRNQTPIPLESFLDDCGLENALWALGAVEGRRDAMRLYACHCARRVLPVLEQRYSDTAEYLRGIIDTADRHARGQTTDAELTSARQAVWTYINPDLNEITDEDGTTSFKKWKNSLSMITRDDLGLKDAALSAAASVREAVEGGVWRASHFAVAAIVLFAQDALDRDVDVRSGALRTTADAVRDAVRSAVESFAEDALKAVAGHVRILPSLDTVRDSALEAVWNVVRCADATDKFRGGIERQFQHEDVADAVKNTVRQEMAVEFRRLCRLEGEYGHGEKE
jgi:hypothetical protein